uniref:NHL repeat containing 2 n=1 Tax=Fundulus heteroclitus TaxID=8078 RepID=A0A3Q2QPJ3_FUNHE
MALDSGSPSSPVDSEDSCNTYTVDTPENGSPKQGPCWSTSCLTTGLMAVSERGNETGRVPCIRVLEPGWNTIRILGVCSGLGPVLTCPWGLCIDRDGDVLVADWGKQHHRVLIYPSKGVGRPLVSDNLNSPRGLALLPDGHMVVSDSMNHCIKIYQLEYIPLQGRKG